MWEKMGSDILWIDFLKIIVFLLDKSFNLLFLLF